MDGCEHHFYIMMTFDGFRREDKLPDLFDKGSVHIFTNDLDKVLVAFETDIIDRCDTVDFRDDIFVVWPQYLSTIVPVCLVAVIFFWVVRCGDHDTALASQLSDRKRYLRGRAQLLEKINLDAVGTENVG